MDYLTLKTVRTSYKGRILLYSVNRSLIKSLKSAKAFSLIGYARERELLQPILKLGLS